MKKTTDHDLLIRLDEKMDAVKLCLTNHLAHHSKYNLMVWTTAASALSALLLSLIRSGIFTNQ